MVKKPKSPYRILGVKPDATKEDIQSAYRKLAMKHHPDRGGDAARFHEIEAAYRLLNDDIRRAHFDRTGDTSEQKPDNELARLMSVIAPVLEGTFRELLVKHQDFRRVDVVKKVTQVLAQDIERLKGEVEQMRKMKTEFMDAVGRLTAPDGEANHLQALMEPSVRQFDVGIANLQADLERKQKALDFVKRYRYRVDEGTQYAFGSDDWAKQRRIQFMATTY